MPRPEVYKVGTRKVPGTTTPINKWDSGDKVSNLCNWAQNLAVNYEEHDGKLWHVPIYWVNARDGRGDVGTLTHALWTKHIDPTQPDPDFSLYTQAQQDEAAELNKLMVKWIQQNPLDPIAVEEPFVSIRYLYGGTPDVIDKNDIVDLKTGFVNEFSAMLQLSSYNNLALENGLTDHALGGIIVQPFQGKIRTYRFSAKTLTMYFKTFLNLLQTYNDEKEFNFKRKSKKRFAYIT